MATSEQAVYQQREQHLQGRFTSMAELGWQFFLRDFAARYRESYLGYVWAFAPALTMTLTLTLAAQAKIVNAGASTAPYPLLALIGTVLWQSFADAVVGPSQAVTQARPLLTRVKVPLGSLIIGKVLDLLFNSLLRSSLIIVGLLLYSWHPTAWTIVGLTGVVVMIAVGLALGIAIAAAGGLYSDAMQAMSFVLTAWMLITPVAYERAATGSTLASLNAWNPITPVLVTFRHLILGSRPDSLLPAFLIVLCAVAALAPAWRLWRLSMHFMIERLGT